MRPSADVAVARLDAAKVTPSLTYRCPKRCRLLRAWSIDGAVLIAAPPIGRVTESMHTAAATQDLDVAVAGSAGWARWVPDDVPAHQMAAHPSGVCRHYGEGLLLPTYATIATTAAAGARHRDVVITGPTFLDVVDGTADTPGGAVPHPKPHNAFTVE